MDSCCGSRSDSQHALRTKPLILIASAAIFNSVAQAGHKGIRLYFVTWKNLYFYTIYGGSHQLEIVTHMSDVIFKTEIHGWDSGSGCHMTLV